jgi:hypothetical protein
MSGAAPCMMSKREQLKPRTTQRPEPRKVARTERCKRLDLTGVRFGSLVAIEYHGAREAGTYWTCRCDCGSIGQYRLSSLRSGKTRQCAECRGMHGQSDTPQYTLWQAMKRAYAVSRKWSTFAGFSQDIQSRPSELCLRPKNRAKPIGPRNFEWVSRSQLRRDIATERDGITLGGITLTMAGWGRLLGITRERVRQRLKKHPIEVALSRLSGARKRGPGRKTKAKRPASR